MEQKDEYNTDSQYAAIIESPRMVKTLSEDGVIYSKAWGWVKTSAKFIAHIKKLRGAKLAIWMTIALSIDEEGTCKLTIKELCEVTGYSHTEVIDSLKEMSVWGYLGINKDQRGNIYTPEFVARGENKPSETLVKKVESTPAYQVESSPSEENADSSINRVKRVNTQIRGIEAAILEGRPVEEDDLPKYQSREKEMTDAFEFAFGLKKSWDWYPDKPSEKQKWDEFRNYLLSLYETDKECFTKYFTWTQQPFVKGSMSVLGIKRNPENFPTSWACFCASTMYTDTKPKTGRQLENLDRE